MKKLIDAVGGGDVVAHLLLTIGCIALMGVAMKPLFTPLGY